MRLGALFGIWLCWLGIAWTGWMLVLRPPALGWVVSLTVMPVTYLVVREIFLTIERRARRR